MEFANLRSAIIGFGRTGVSDEVGRRRNSVTETFLLLIYVIPKVLEPDCIVHEKKKERLLVNGEQVSRALGGASPGSAGQANPG